MFLTYCYYLFLPGFLSLSLSLSLSLCLSLSLSHSVFLCLSVSVCLSLIVCVCLRVGERSECNLIYTQCIKIPHSKSCSDVLKVNVCCVYCVTDVITMLKTPLCFKLDCVYLCVCVCVCVCVSACTHICVCVCV